MIEFMLWILGIVWRTLSLVIGIMVFFDIIKNGGKTIRAILDTLAQALPTAGCWIRDRMRRYLKKSKESEEAQKKAEDDHPVTLEELDGFCKKYGYPTKAELQKLIEEQEASLN